MKRIARLVLLALPIGAGPALPAAAEPKFDAFESSELLNQSGAQVPLDALFRDESGRQVRFGDLLDDRPIILAPVYYRCPNVCSVTLGNLMTGLSTVPLEPGQDYRVIAYSIDDSEGPGEARTAKHRALRRFHGGGDAEGFTFLTGGADSIARVSQAIGFRYVRDEQTGQYQHVVAVAALTPAGRVARWLYGLDYQPSNLRLALLDAGNGRLGDLGDKLLLLCHRYDPTTGAYTNIVRPAMRAGAGLTLVLLAAFIGISLWRERTRGWR